jgi:peroxiredoxin
MRRLLCLGTLVLLAGCSVPSAKPEPHLAQQAVEDLEKRGFKALSGPLSSLVEDPSYEGIPTQVHPLLNQSAPDFTLTDVDGQKRTLAEFHRDGPLVLVFYYGYTCNHCVSQLFGLNKDLEKFRELGVTVVAISPDSAETTKEKYAKYGAFDFAVLSDPENRVAETYGAYNRETDEPSHATLVITRNGKVVWVNRGEEPFINNRTLLVECFGLVKNQQ